MYAKKQVVNPARHKIGARRGLERSRIKIKATFRNERGFCFLGNGEKRVPQQLNRIIFEALSNGIREQSDHEN